MRERPPLGIVFDMDGVLVDSAQPHLESWQRLAVENNRVVTREQFAATFGRQNRDIIPPLFGPLSAERLNALADRKEEIYRELIRTRPPIVEGAVELVRALGASGAPMAIGSSGPRVNIDLVLTAMQLDGLIRVIVSSDDVTRGKPDPQVFTLACERLGLQPGRCVVIEDAPAGIEAARAAGAKSVAVLMHHPREAFPLADLVVKRLRDLSVEQLYALVERESPPGRAK